MVAAIQISELLQGLVDVSGIDLAVTGLQLDSRKVSAGDLFVALPGTRVHGQTFITAAIDAGAIAVLVEDEASLPETTVPCIVVPQLQDRLGQIAERFYGFPSRQLFVMGITGTNGKTSCAHFIAQALNANAMPTVVVGTLGNGFVTKLEPTTHTTPDAITLHGMMRQFVDAGARYLVMEVSSHALTQGRVNGVAFDLVLFTNLSRDHLDYHMDMETYGQAKARLFTMPGLKYAVINVDDAFGSSLLECLADDVEVVTYSLAQQNGDQSVVHGEILSQNQQGMLIEVQTPWGDGRIQSELLGRFNGSNLLGVLAVLVLSGINFDAALQNLLQIKTVPGRAERFGGQADQPLVVVDYAHTPDALEQILFTLREHCLARLWCVFGCGGERDRGKRAEMGSIAARLADHVVLTDDNPRYEDADVIIADIMAGITIQNVVVMRDRATAIHYAVTHAQVDDVVLVAGKGHEAYQQIGDQRIEFSDRQHVQQALRVAA